MIAIVDYGAGNLPSVERALAALGAETERAVRPEQLKELHIRVDLAPERKPQS